jgi:5-methylcytosine-specific restriction enzyme subunit McrC
MIFVEIVFVGSNIERNSALDIQKAERSLTTITEANSPALTLVRLINDMAGVQLEVEGTSNRISGFLFDMNRFFQRLLSRFVREH